MYPYLLFFHSLLRWLVLGSLLYAIVRSAGGWYRHTAFTNTDNRLRHITATIAHIQLAVGYILYFNSPLIAYFRTYEGAGALPPEYAFFGWIHILLMTLAVVLITIGSSVAKRAGNDVAKFRTITIWYTVALIIIFIAIPWPSSPLAQRPYIRTI